MNPLTVEVLRGTRIESVHRAHVVVCSGRATAPPTVVFTAGDADYVSFVRSAIKMFQALPLVEDGGVEEFGLTEEELALTCASHNGEPFHVGAVRSILTKARVPEDALACGPHDPMYPPAAAALVSAGDRPGRLHNNCSGKHAGLLALARFHEWPLDGYHLMPHPVQRRILETLAGWSDFGLENIDVAIDGCGLPTFALPLRHVASACARLAFVSADMPNEPAARVVGAMMRHPEFVAGTARLCTDLIRATSGRVFAKVGAEGYYCAGVPNEAVGIAVKVEDGAKRASEPVLLAVLDALNLVTDSELSALQQYAEPTVLNTRGETVGRIRVKGLHDEVV